MENKKSFPCTTAVKIPWIHRNFYQSVSSLLSPLVITSIVPNIFKFSNGSIGNQFIHTKTAPLKCTCLNQYYRSLHLFIFFVVKQTSNFFCKRRSLLYSDCPAISDWLCAQTLKRQSNFKRALMGNFRMLSSNVVGNFPAFFALKTSFLSDRIASKMVLDFIRFVCHNLFSVQEQAD